jgi:hypothetical protein
MVLTFKKWVEKIPTPSYKGAHTVYQLSSLYSTQIFAINPMIQNSLKSIHSDSLNSIHLNRDFAAKGSDPVEPF